MRRKISFACIFNSEPYYPAVPKTHYDLLGSENAPDDGQPSNIVPHDQLTLITTNSGKFDVHDCNNVVFGMIKLEFVFN